MDKSSATLLDLEIDEAQSDAADKLQFQEFTTTHVNVAELDVTTSAKDQNALFQSSPADGTGRDGDPNAEQPVGPSFWTFSYYQNLFDVNTDQVLNRILYSMVPRPSKSYLDNVIKPKPDLYGPFWICVTLVFTIAVSRNLVSYQQFLEFTSTKPYHWKYEFHTVSYAATAIFSYAWLLPLLVWGVMWWQGSNTRMSFLEILCIYGYSLSIFIPVSVLWVVQLGWLQWLLLALSAGLSGAVLVLSVWPAALSAGRHVALPLALAVLALHTLLAAGFMIFFFHTSVSEGFPVTPSVVTTISQLQLNHTLSSLTLTST